MPREIKRRKPFLVKRNLANRLSDALFGLCLDPVSNELIVIIHGDNLTMDWLSDYIGVNF